MKVFHFLKPECHVRMLITDILICHMATVYLTLFPEYMLSIPACMGNLKVYMTDFLLFAQLNLPNVLISVAEIFFNSDFPSLCFDVPKASNFTSGGVQNRDTKNRRLGTIATSIQDSKPREKQISQSFCYCELINLLRNGTIVRCS